MERRAYQRIRVKMAFHNDAGLPVTGELDTHLSRAFLADCRQDRMLEIVHAKRDILNAIREFCHFDSQLELRYALPNLSLYLMTERLMKLRIYRAFDQLRQTFFNPGWSIRA